MQYVGARYVPKFMDTYDPTTTYENMCVVDNGMGTSYISKKPVPAGTPLTDTEYWAIYGASNGAIINLQNQIGNLSSLTTSDKSNLVAAINENNILAKRNNGYVTLEEFGAVGDGVTDDHQAFVDALDYAYLNGCGIKLLPKEYYTSQQIEITHPDTIISSDCEGTKPTIISFNGISIKNNNTILEHFTLYGDISQPLGSKTGVGISMDVLNANYILLNDLVISSFDKCISHTQYFFGLCVNNCRFYSSNYAMVTLNMGAGLRCYDITFNDCWFLSTTKLFIFRNCIATFNDCITDINADECIMTDALTTLSFNQCSFEMTTHVPDTGAKYFFYLYGDVNFFRCNFTENTESTMFWLVTAASTVKIAFLECRFDAYSNSTKTGGLVSAIGVSATPYGCVIVDHCLKYGERIYKLVSPIASAPLINVVDGIGIALVDGAFDTSKVIDDIEYTIVNNYGGFKHKQVFHTGAILSTSIVTGFNKGSVYDRDISSYNDGNEFTFSYNGYVNVNNTGSGTISLKLYGTDGTGYMPVSIAAGGREIIPVFVGMKIGVNNASTDQVKFYYMSP